MDLLELIILGIMIGWLYLGLRIYFSLGKYFDESKISIRAKYNAGKFVFAILFLAMLLFLIISIIYALIAFFS